MLYGRVSHTTVPDFCAVYLGFSCWPWWAESEASLVVWLIWLSPPSSCRRLASLPFRTKNDVCRGDGPGELRRYAMYPQTMEVPRFQVLRSNWQTINEPCSSHSCQLRTTSFINLHSAACRSSPMGLLFDTLMTFSPFGINLFTTKSIRHPITSQNLLELYSCGVFS